MDNSDKLFAKWFDQLNSWEWPTDKEFPFPKPFDWELVDKKGGCKDPRFLKAWRWINSSIDIEDVIKYGEVRKTL